MWVGGVWAGNGYTVPVPVQCPTPLNGDHGGVPGRPRTLTQFLPSFHARTRREREKEGERRGRDATAAEAALVEQFSRK